MENTKDKGIFARISDWFTVKGLLGSILLAFVIIIILSSISFLPSIMSRISSSLSAALYSVFVPAENATITTDKIIVNSGEDFIINFKKVDSTPGIFTVTHTCNSSVSLVSVESNGLRKIDCDKPFYLLENETSLKIRPTTADNVVRLVIEGAFENSDTLKSEKVGVARITIKNNSIGVIATQPTTVSAPTVTTNTTTYAAPAIQSTYYGKPDLAVRVLQVGILNQYTNLITSQSQFSSTNMVGIKFEVRNDGDANTGIWSFTASLPSVSTPTYTSNTQISLRPGESIIFTLGFSNLTNTYTGLITINVDPQSIVSESVEYNNIATQSITNLGYNTNYYNNTNYSNNTTGCYVNGFFTYNCNNSNNNGWTNNSNVNGYYDTYGNFISYNNNNYSNGYYDSYGNFVSYNNNNYNSNFGVSCYGVVTRNNRDDMVIYWYSTPFGGSGVYSYNWSGSESLTSTSQNPSAKTYYYSGTKYATVTVKSNGAYVSQTCNVYVN